MFAVFLGVISIFASILIVWFLFRAIMPSLRGRRDAYRLKKLNSMVEKIDQFMAEGRFQDAAKVIEYAFIYDIPNSRRGVRILREHHQNVLGRMLLIAEEVGVTIENLSEIERLLLEQAEIQSLAIQAQESFERITSRREQAGKDIPKWSKGEFENKKELIREEITRNKKQLEFEISQLLALLLSRSPSTVTYH